MAADIIVIVIVAGFAIFGYKKGFVRSIVGILSLAASIVLAWLLYPVVADLLVAFGVESALVESIQATLSTYMGGGAELETLPEAIRSAAEQGRDGMILGAAEAVAQIVLNIIAFLAVLLLSRIAIWIGIRVLNILANLPVIGFFNRTAGLLLGAVQGVIVVYIILTVIYAAAPLRESTAVSTAIQGSALTASMYENNPIINIFEGDRTEADTKQGEKES